jgi:NodT family efflux transporter outer membrane factor (OMF) lipoprotein
MRRYLKHTIGYCLSFLFLAGCSVGPRYEPPVAITPAHWHGVGKPIATDGRVWWRHFHDPLLNELIEQQAIANFNVQMAQARVQAAQEEYRLAYAQLFPRFSADALPPNATGAGLTQLLALSASLEPDLFGRQRQEGQRAKASLDAQLAERDFTLLNLQAEIASSYLELREAQARNKILRNNVAGNRQVSALLKSSYDSGLSNYLDIAQQKALVETQEAEIEQNNALVMMILHKIEMLTGNNPDLLAKKLLPYKPVPVMKQTITLGMPSELLSRRPDIVAAERRVAASHANIRVAIANLFPKVTVGWLLGWQTQTLASNIIAAQNSDSTFFGTLNAPILDLRLHRIVDLRKREKVLAVINYQMVVMQALHEVKTQYDYCQHYKQSMRHFKSAVEQKQLALKLAKDMYQKGASTFNTLLLSEHDLSRLELTYLHNQVIYQIAQINLYKALGGDVKEI